MLSMAKKYIAAAFLLLALLILSGFTPSGIMPFNGDISFHEIHLTIPESYIRDSTQSNDDFWIFEKGFYSSYIMLSRNDIAENADAYLDDYAAYLQQQGIQSRRGNYMQLDSVFSSDSNAEMQWHELLFVHDGSAYAVALRGGSKGEFLSILHSLGVADSTI